MINFFPYFFSNKAIAMYFVLLVFIPICFFDATMKWYWMVIGAVEVCGFFYFSNILTERWSIYPSALFEKKLFWTALSIRIVYVLFSYIFYQEMTGQPFEFYTGDASFYDEIARYASDKYAKGHFTVFFERNSYTKGLDISDTGYPFYLSIIYYLTGDSILVPRLIKAVISAFTCILIYRFSLRNFGEGIAKMAAIFCMLMPNLIYYCGMHLKETEMLFLILLFAERADYAIRQINGIDYKAWILALLVAALLFTFRTALGIVAILSMVCMVVLTTKRILPTWKKLTLGLFLVLGLALSVGSNIASESVELWKARSTNQQASMQWRAERDNGNKFAKYAKESVFAPVILTIPFATMVDVPGQENQQMIHGGNFVKNVLSILVLYAIVLLFVTGDWRKHILLLTFTGGYLLVIAASAFAQSERFHLPVLPFEMILVAYGVANIKLKYLPWFNRWLVALFFINIAWAWFKLKGRGLI